jgi:RimJ/RimL family protein N-acetyltransferase
MLTPEQTKYLETELVQTREQIRSADRLCQYYCREPLTLTNLDKVVNSDWWKHAELLTDVILYGKDNFSQREPVGFLLLTEMNPNKKTKTTDLAVSIFAHRPFYDLDVLTNWADYVLDKQVKELGRINRTVWCVDERNVPLQVELRNIGFRVHEYDRQEELMIFVR